MQDKMIITKEYDPLAHCAKNRKEWNDLHKLVAKRKKKARYRGTG